MPSGDLFNGEINEKNTHDSASTYRNTTYRLLPGSQSEQSEETGWLSGFIRFVCNAMLA